MMKATQTKPAQVLLIGAMEPIGDRRSEAAC